MKRSRLLTKVLIGEVLLFAAIGLITSGLAAYTLYTRLSSEFLSKGTAIANSIANASDELILTRDASTIQSLVDQFRVGLAEPRLARSTDRSDRLMVSRAS